MIYLMVLRASRELFARPEMPTQRKLRLWRKYLSTLKADWFC